MRFPSVTPSMLSRILDWFIVLNLAFLSLDVYLAHSENHFRDSVEWVPVFFSLLGPLALLPGALGTRGRTRKPLWLTIGALSVAVGILGLVEHMTDAFFVEHTLQSLVYAAPFAAPLSYAGIGLLALLQELRPNQRDWARWVLLLAMGGVFGNFALSLTDHAINGFFRWTEWIPVVGSAFASSALLLLILVPADRPLLGLALGALLLQVIIGLVGFVLHVLAPTHGWGTPHSSLVTGAPLLAPLLFCDLAVLGAIGWSQLHSSSQHAE